MLQPKRTKYRKLQKGRNRGLAHRGSDLNFGDFGLQATEAGYINARQIAAERIAMHKLPLSTKIVDRREQAL